MKDIRSLYLTASKSGRSSDIRDYTEAVQETLKSDPIGYLSNLEYIIQSSIGASTLSEFIESYGLPIAMYDQVASYLERAIEKGEAYSKDVSAQKKAMGYLEAMRAKYPTCFMMFESMVNDDQRPSPESYLQEYVKTYYGKNEKGVQNRKLMVGMLNRFHEMAIPDLFVTAGSVNNTKDTVTTIVEYFNRAPYTLGSTNYQWIRECASDLDVTDISGRVLTESLQNIVENCKSRNTAVIREAMILDDDTKMLEYSYDEFKAIEDLIALREYQMLYLEGDAQIKCYNEIMSLYEEIEGIVPEDYCYFPEFMNPRSRTIKEIAGRMKKLAEDVCDYSNRAISNHGGFEIKVAFGDRSGPYLWQKKGLLKGIKNNMSDISDFGNEFIDNIILYLFFTVEGYGEHEADTIATDIVDDALEALDPLIIDDRIKPIRAMNPSHTPRYWNFYVPFAIGKTYVVGDSDLGMFESFQAMTEAVSSYLGEANWMYGATAKKTGRMPLYISQNHDLGYGEMNAPSIEDYRRPSATKDDDGDNDGYHSTTPDDAYGDDSSSSEEDGENDISGGSKDAATQAVNNYYYYTYNNSLNKNQGSFNTHNQDDHSVHTQDDHSSNKRINSDNINNGEPHEESARNLSREFMLFGVKFELPAEIGGLHSGKAPKNTEAVKQKAHNKMLKLINSAKKIKKIEEAILEEERHIGENKDTDETRIARIKKYLTKASIKHYEYTPKGNAIFKIDIPYVKGVTCAWEEHEMWITSDGRVEPYDSIEFYESGDDAGPDNVVMPMDESTVVDHQFTEASNYYMDGDTYDMHVKKIWFIKSDNGIDNCCVQVDGYAQAMRGRSIMIALKKVNDEWQAMIKQKLNGAWEFPGGGWDRGETPQQAAERELHEEAQINIKNIKRIGTQIQYNPKKKAVSPWVKKHVANSRDWWYGYYTAVFIGEEDGAFTGHIEEEDFEDTFKWKSINFISKKLPSKIINAIEAHIEQIDPSGSPDNGEEDIANAPISEAVDVTNKKFDKAYKAAFNYENGHLIKVTYSLHGCEITNVGMSKAMRDHIASVAEEVNRENHRGNRNTKKIRAFMVILKGILHYKKNIKKRKKLLTNFLNENIGDVGYLDFQAKDCQIIEMYDCYTHELVTEPIPVVGIFAARWMDSGKSTILSDKDLAAVHANLEAGHTKFHIAKEGVGDVATHPTFMSTYWNDHDDHYNTDLSNRVIDSDERDMSVDVGLDNVADIIGDLEMKGFHVSDEETMEWLNKYRSTEKWIPDAVSAMARKDSISTVSEAVDFDPDEIEMFLLTESIFDTIKTKAKAAIQKIKGILGLRKSLANIQQLDKPSVIRKKVPLTIVGTNYVIGSEIPGVKKEYTTSDLDHLLNHGYYLKEDTTIPSLSKADIANIVKRLQKKFDAEIVFIHANSNATAAVGPAAVIETNRESINKIIKGQALDENYPSKMSGYTGHMDKVIVVNPKVLQGFACTTARDVELVISHEYGHVLTLDQITQDDWIEYGIKRQLIAGLAGFADPGSLDIFSGQISGQTGAECNFFYYKLKPEFLANKAAGIDPSDLCYALLKARPTGKIEGMDIDKVVTWKIPEVTRNISQNPLSMTRSTYIESINISRQLYSEVILDAEMKETMINQLEAQLKLTDILYPESYFYQEKVGDADNDRPRSDNLIQDTMMDIDKELGKYQQKGKHAVQKAQNAGRALVKPVKRTKALVDDVISKWKDADETKIKENLADPHTGNVLIKALKTCIKYGALNKAGLLLNPIFLFIAGLTKWNKHNNQFRLRNEMIGELKMELEIIDQKIEDAKRKDTNEDRAAVYQLMRFKNELNKKLLRVGGTKEFKKII